MTGVPAGGFDQVARDRFVDADDADRRSNVEDAAAGVGRTSTDEAGRRRVETDWIGVDGLLETGVEVSEEEADDTVDDDRSWPY